MASGRKTSLVIQITREEEDEIQHWQRSTTTRAGLVRRGKVILLLAKGLSVSDVARTVGIRRRLIYKWAKRFTKHRLEGLSDKKGRGRKAVFSPRGGHLSGQNRLRATG